MSKRKVANYVKVPHETLPGILVDIPKNRKAKLIDAAVKRAKTQPGQNRQKPKRRTK